MIVIDLVLSSAERWFIVSMVSVWTLVKEMKELLNEQGCFEANAKPLTLHEAMSNALECYLAIEEQFKESKDERI